MYMCVGIILLPWVWLQVTMSAESDMPGRWSNVRKLLEREGPFAHPDFQANPGVR